MEGTAALLATDDATVGQLIDERKIRALPIPGKRCWRCLGAGMSRGPASSVTTSGFGPGFGIAAMGQKARNNWIMLDGAPLRTSIHAAARMRPSVEAGFYSAEFGAESGAQTISAIKPGANRLHGVLFEFLRNEKLDARNFLERPETPKRTLRRNNFGGVVSGPILRRKLFYTANYEAFVERRSTQGLAVYILRADETRRPDRAVFPRRSKRERSADADSRWQTNGVLTLETGMPMHPLQGTKPLNDECSRCNHRPDRVAEGGSRAASARSGWPWATMGAPAATLFPRRAWRAWNFSLFMNFRVAEA